MTVLVGGLAIGAVYSLVALGVVLIYRATSVVNFAQGELLMVSAYAYVIVSEYTKSPLLQLLAALGTGALAGLVCFVVTQLLLRNATPLAKVIGTLALLIFAQSGAIILFSANPRPASAWIVGSRSFSFDGVTISDNSLVIVVLTGLASVGLFLWLGSTNYGRGMRAVAEDSWRASLSGIHVGKMLATSWLVGGVMAGLGGLLVAPIVDVYPTMGASIIFPAFIAALIGGFTNLMGALVGGVILGVVETYAVVYVGGAWENVAAFAVLLLLLLWRPSGIFQADHVRAV